jgi:glycosyltransferase involved in cell wall biosynthesis
VPASRPSAVHQVVGALHPGDAVGNEALAIRRHLRESGLGSEIFAGWVDPRLDREAHPLGELVATAAADAACLYHFSPGSPAGRAALASRGPLVLAYHNVTPARFFAGYSWEAARLAVRAGAELRELAPRTALALAKSRFSLGDLEQAGFARVGRLPFVLETRQSVAPSPVFRRLYSDGRTNLLSVGRLAPNKRVEDLVRAFAVLQRRMIPSSRLLLVGDTGIGVYARALERLVRELRLQHVVFCGHVEEDELRAAYELADVYVSLSEHEGYGVPLVEAMLAGVPVVARAAGAVAETLDGAGILVQDPRPELVAGLLEKIVRDLSLRAAVLEGQEKVARRLRDTDYGALVRDALAPVLEEKA